MAHFYDSPSPSDSSDYTTPRPASRFTVAHPYARLYAKKEEVKRRKIWNHTLEKALFTPYELSVSLLFYKLVDLTL